MSEKTEKPAARKKAAGTGAARSRRVSAAARSGLTPLQYMVQVLRDETLTHAVRMDAAKTAAPYLHARMATVDSQPQNLDRLGDALQALIERAQEGGGGVAGLIRR